MLHKISQAETHSDAAGDSAGNVLDPNDSPVTPDLKSLYRTIVVKLGCPPSSHGMSRELPQFSLGLSKVSDYCTVVGLDGYCDTDWENSSSLRSTTGNLF